MNDTPQTAQTPAIPLTAHAPAAQTLTTQTLPDLLPPGVAPGEGWIATVRSGLHEGMGSDDSDAPMLLPELWVAGRPFAKVAMAMANTHWDALEQILDPQDERRLSRPHHVESGPLLVRPRDALAQESWMDSGHKTLWCCSCGHSGCGSTQALVHEGRLNGVEGVWLTDFVTRDNPHSELGLPPLFVPDAAWPRATRYRREWYRPVLAVLPERPHVYRRDGAQALRALRQSSGRPLGAREMQEIQGAYRPLKASDPRRAEIQAALQALWVRTQPGALAASRQAAAHLSDPWGRGTGRRTRDALIREDRRKRVSWMRSLNQPAKRIAEIERRIAEDEAAIRTLQAEIDAGTAPVPAPLSEEEQLFGFGQRSHQERIEILQRGIEAQRERLAFFSLSARDRRVTARAERRARAQNPEQFETDLLALFGDRPRRRRPTARRSGAQTDQAVTPGGDTSGEDTSAPDTPAR